MSLTTEEARERHGLPNPGTPYHIPRHEQVYVHPRGPREVDAEKYCLVELVHEAEERDVHLRITLHRSRTGKWIVTSPEIHWNLKQGFCTAARHRVLSDDEAIAFLERNGWKEHHMEAIGLYGDGAI